MAEKRTGPMFLEDLEQAHCESPGCTHTECEIILGASCHPDSGMQIAYCEGNVRVYCGRCLKPVALIAVARKPCN
jgi:hypothetical protein